MLEEKPQELTPRHQRFVEEYLRDRNLTQAAIRAGYSPRSAGKQGWELMNSPKYRHVQKAVLEASRDLQRNTQELQEGLRRQWAAMARPDLRAVLPPDGESFTMEHLRALSPEVMACISQIKQTTWVDHEGTPKVDILVKFYNALQAGKLLGNHIGMFDRRVDQGGAIDLDGARAKVAEFMDKLMAARNELARAAARALARAQREAAGKPEPEGGPGT